MTVAACAVTALASTSAAYGPGGDGGRPAQKEPTSVHVRRQFIPIDDKGTYRITGDLKGTWYTLTADTYYQSDAMIIQEGVERFEGCLDVNGDRRCDRRGHFGADYIYWATFNPHTGRLIEGECIHPITAGNGGFTRMRGFLNVHDKPVGRDGVVSTYEGELVLNAVPEEDAKVNAEPPATMSPVASAVTC
jgi:hypothetical protein